MDYVPRSPFSVSIMIIDVANMSCDRTQISGLAARAHNAQARIGGCGHTSDTKLGEKSKSPLSSAELVRMRARISPWPTSEMS